MPTDVADNHDGVTCANQPFSPLIELKFVLSVGLDDHGLRDRDTFKFAWRLENNSQAVVSVMRARIIHRDLGLRLRIDHPVERFWVRESDGYLESTIPKLPGRRQLARVGLKFT